jgi:hypothetical protein
MPQDIPLNGLINFFFLSKRKNLQNCVCKDDAMKNKSRIQKIKLAVNYLQKVWIYFANFIIPSSEYANLYF